MIPTSNIMNLYTDKKRQIEFKRITKLIDTDILAK